MNPNFADAHSNLGNALRDAGQLDEGVVACRRAIALNPDLPDFHSDLGESLREHGQLDEAIAAYHDALALNPNFAGAHNNLANALKDNGQIEEALAAYGKAISLDPADAALHSNLVFAMNYHPGCDADSIAHEHRLWNRRHTEPLAKFITPHSNDADPGRRLRIGYVSPDFHNHVVGRNLLPLFRERDHSRFEIVCYAQVRSPDALTLQFQQFSDSWRTTMGVSDEQLADQVRQDQIDILVDLALHTAGNRLLVFARKPAPVQATFAGYPGSTGLTSIDYRLSDPYLDPVGMDESIYSERTIRLPNSFWCFDPLDCRDIGVAPLSAVESGVITFGCLNNFCKINLSLLELWAKVMRQVADSRLLLYARHGEHRQRLIDNLHHLGIDPQRIEFVPHQTRRAYLEQYHRIDIGLDTFPYNGHTTSLDSFWMGVPVVTLVGNRAVARAGWCQLSNLGLGELAAETPEQFVQIAVKLAGDIPRLQQIRSSLRRRMETSPLMDAPRFARNIEMAYRKMWRDWSERGVTRPS